MQTAKPGMSFKYDSYDITLNIINEKKLAISVIDSIMKVQYFQKELTLENVGVNTLIKAFERAKKQIKIEFLPKKGPEIDLLEIKVSIESPFLRAVEETLYLKKIRDVSETQTIKKSIDHLTKRIRVLKEANEGKESATYFGASIESKKYNGSTYEPLASVKLPKGKYLLTFSFLVKPDNQWMYLYFNQGGSIIANCGFYMPASGYFMPQTVRKVHSVNTENETVTFTTYCANSYPITVKNAIIIAKPLKE